MFVLCGLCGDGNEKERFHKLSTSVDIPQRKHDKICRISSFNVILKGRKKQEVRMGIYGSNSQSRSMTLIENDLIWCTA